MHSLPDNKGTREHFCIAVQRNTRWDPPATFSHRGGGGDADLAAKHVAIWGWPGKNSKTKRGNQGSGNLELSKPQSKRGNLETWNWPGKNNKTERDNLGTSSRVVVMMYNYNPLSQKAFRSSRSLIAPTARPLIEPTDAPTSCAH